MPIPTPIVKPKFFDNVPWHRVADHVGTPLAAATRLYDGEMVPGEWTGTISDKSGANAVLTFLSTYSKHSQHGVPYPVILDGSTLNKVLRGWAIALAADAEDGDQIKVYSGRFIGSAAAGNPQGKQLSDKDGFNSPGLSPTGTAGRAIWVGRYGWENISGQMLTEAFSKIFTPHVHKPTAGAGFVFSDIIQDVTPQYVGGIGGAIQPYEVTFANKGGGRIDVFFDGEIDYSYIGDDGSAGASLEQLKHDGGTLYQITSGPLSGRRLAIDPLVANSDTGQDYVYPREWIEMTPDAGGEPTARSEEDGEELWGMDPYAHQAGAEAERGEIMEGVTAYGHAMVTLPVGARFLANPVPLFIHLQANVSGAGGL